MQTGLNVNSALHTGHATLCDLSSKHYLFQIGQICGHRTTLTQSGLLHYMYYVCHTAASLLVAGAQHCRTEAVINLAFDTA